MSMTKFAQICLINKYFTLMKKDEMLSFNSEFSEFELQQLEERLETDPLAIGGLLDFSAGEEGINPACWFDCPNLSSCDLSC